MRVMASAWSAVMCCGVLAQDVDYESDFGWARDPALAAALAQSSADAPQDMDEAVTQVTGTPPPAEFGAARTWWWNAYGTAAAAYGEDGEHYGVTWAASYFLEQNFSVDFELAGLYFNQPKDEPPDTFGGNFNILFRWHFVAKEDWTLFVDGGAGLLAVADEVPYGGSNLNFTPQAGLGATLDLGPNTDGRLLLGLRWHHISNARTRGNDENPGRNAPQIFIGVSFPF